jgi:hypothetical protein
MEPGNSIRKIGMPLNRIALNQLKTAGIRMSLIEIKGDIGTKDSKLEEKGRTF